MFSVIKDWVIAKIFTDGFKHVEKQDFVLKAMTKCYTVKDLKAVWPAFCTSVISLLEDAIEEVKEAKEWK